MLIGLNGRLGAGKNTAANILSALLEQDYDSVVQASFAAPLKDSAAALWGLTLEELEALKLSPEYCMSLTKPDGTVVMMTGRQYLEEYGTAAHRDVFGASFWVDQALSPDAKCDPSVAVLFTDCRFPNEAMRIRALGGYVIEVVGPNGREGNGHPSDTPLPDDMIDVFVNNAVRDDNYKTLIDQLERALIGLRQVAR